MYDVLLVILCYVHSIVVVLLLLLLPLLLHLLYKVWWLDYLQYAYFHLVYSPSQCDAESGEAVVRVAGRQRLNAVAWHPKQALLCVAIEDRLPSPQYLRFLSFAESSTV